MSLVQQMTPLNLQEEKQKFFDKGCKYNPQFKYKELITLNKLQKYGEPKQKYLELAETILDEAFNRYSEQELRELEGEQINAEQGMQMLEDFILKNNLQDKIKVSWIEGHISKASAYKNEFKLRKDFDYREKQFLATLYHEVGTHFLRRLNYVEQPFYGKKGKLEFANYLFTEEGLASLHSQLAANYKLDYYHALTYVATDVAQKSSFIKTYEFIHQYLKDELRAWRLTVKMKRGLYDTSEPGGFTKSIVYLEGMAEVWQYLKASNFDVEGLYYGKIAAKDVNKAREMNPDFKPQLPHFYTQDRQAYEKQIRSIAKINHLDSVQNR
jgi:hypothetical protein